MGNLIEYFCKFKQITSTWFPLERCLAILWIVNINWVELLPKAMLVFIQSVEPIQGGHYTTVYYMLKNIACYLCKGHWMIVGRCMSLTFLEDGHNSVSFQS